MDESILMNYLRGGCNDEECQQVELWCEEAPENRQILEQLYYTLFVGDRMAVMDAVDTEVSLTKFKSLVREKEKKAKRRSISVRWGRYASATAAFLAGLVFAGGIYNPQIQISAESETKRSIFREKDKTKRSKKESAQHSKSRNKSFVMTSVSAL
ncbi:hypothetical protein NXX98_20215 [Bacteroides thetaiotaomicron]|nr:hypothetical protein [Bacteroides thetaiotaomicron]